MYNLEELQIMRVTEVNERTVELLDKGFTFEHIIFPVTDEDQRNYLGLNVAALNQLVTGVQMLDFTSDNRLKIKGVDVGGNVIYYTPGECSDIITFFMTGMTFVNSTLQSGWVLKDAIKTATTVEEVEAIMDER